MASRAPGPPSILTAAEARRAIHDHLPQVAQGKGRVLTLLGPAETGKSRLLADVLGEARGEGWTGLLATGSPRTHEVPRGLVMDALRPLLPGIASGPAPMTEAGAGPPIGLPLALAALLPTQDRTKGVGAGPSTPRYLAPWELPSSTTPAEGDALLLHRLWEATRRAPVLLALDDLQWMDDLSQRFVSSLCLAASAHRVLVLLGLDPESAPPLVRRFALRESGGLADGVLTLVRASPGRPRPLPPPGPPSPEEVEPSLLETLLSLGAVIGIEFDVPTLAAATGKPAEEIETTLEEGARRGWLWKAGEGSYHFSGERTWRWALGLPYASLTARHARVARTLETLHPDPDGRTLFALAHHWHEAGGPARAYPYMIRSAEISFAAGAYEVARDRLLRAQGMLPSLPGPERGVEEVGMLVLLAEVLDALGQGNQAATRLREALTRAEVARLPVREVVRIEVLLADLHRRWGRGEDAWKVLEKARVRAAEAPDLVAQAMVLSREAMVQRRQGHWAAARDSVQKALALLGDEAGPEADAIVHYAAADTFLWGGAKDEAEARAHIRRARDAVARLEQPNREVPLRNLEGLLASQRGDQDRALELWGSAAQLALRQGNLVEAANMFANRAEVLAEVRRFEEAREDMRLARELVEGMEEPRIGGQIHLAAATLAWREGDAPRADRELDQGIALLSSDASVDLRQQLEFLRARMRWSEGKGTEARAITATLDPLRYPHLLPPVQVAEWEQMHARGPPSPAS